MTTRNVLRCLGGVMMAAAISAAGGCAAGSAPAADPVTTACLDTLRNDLTVIDGKIAPAVTAMEAAVKPGADKAAADKFAAEREALSDAVHAMRDHRSELYDKGAAAYGPGGATSGPAKERYDRLVAVLNDLRPKMRGLMTGLRDVKATLDDPAKGAAAAAEPAKKIGGEADSARAAIKDTSAKLAAIEKELGK